MPQKAAVISRCFGRLKLESDGGLAKDEGGWEGTQDGVRFCRSPHLLSVFLHNINSTKQPDGDAKERFMAGTGWERNAEKMNVSCSLPDKNFGIRMDLDSCLSAGHFVVGGGAAVCN